MAAAKTDPLEALRAKKQDLLEQIQKATGDPDKQEALQAQLRDLRKEKAAHVATVADESA